MKKIKMIACCVMAALTLSACSTAVREGNSMGANTYTENQKTILIAAGTTEERLEKGTLIPAETKLLEMLAAAEKHLAERYSGTAFTFTGLDTTLPRGDRYHFLASDGRNEFAVLVWPGEKNTYKISDSYFSDLKREELNEFCEEVLAGFGLKAKADLELTGVYGSEYSHTVSLKNILESGKMIGISGWVFAETLSGLEAIQPEMEKALCSAGLCGGFELRLVEGVTLARAYESPRTERSFVAAKSYVSLPDQSSEVK